jgi:ADP-ribose pyrophosphatase
MARLIAYGPLLDADVANGLIGRDPAGEAVDLEGLALVQIGPGLVPAPVGRSGAVTPARSIGLAPAELARLDFVLGALGLERRPLAGAEGAESYLPQDTPDRAAPAWDAGEWARHRKPLLVELIAETLSILDTGDVARARRLLPTLTARALARVRGAGSTTPVIHRSGLRAADIEQLANTRPYRAFFAVEEHALRHRRFDGDTSDTIHRAVFVNGDAVTVVPYDPEADTVLLVEQFRIGPHARRDPVPWCLEAVAGRCDIVEPLEEVARREAREEAELELGRLERVAAYYSTPGVTSEFITAFIGEARLEGAGGLHGLAHEHEDIRAIILPLDEALGMIATGEANNGPLLISLLWLQANRDRLRRLWREPPAGRSLEARGGSPAPP